LCNSTQADHPRRPSLATAAAQGESSQKSDTINAAVLEKASTIPQDLDDKDISLQVFGPDNGI